MTITQDLTPLLESITGTNITIKSKAIGDGFLYSDSEWSNVISFSRVQLTAPTVTQSASEYNDTIQWDAVNRATYYKLYSGTDIVTTTTTTSIDMGDYKSLITSTDLYVSACSPLYVESEKTSAGTMTRVATPSSVSLSTSTLSWGTVSGASSYTISYGDDKTIIATVTGTTTDLCSYVAQLPQSTTVYVRANTTQIGKICSEWSNGVAVSRDIPSVGNISVTLTFNDYYPYGPSSTEAGKIYKWGLNEPYITMTFSSTERIKFDTVQSAMRVPHVDIEVQQGGSWIRLENTAYSGSQLKFRIEDFPLLPSSVDTFTFRAVLFDSHGWITGQKVLQGTVQVYRHKTLIIDYYRASTITYDVMNLYDKIESEGSSTTSYPPRPNDVKVYYKQDGAWVLWKDVLEPIWYRAYGGNTSSTSEWTSWESGVTPVPIEGDTNPPSVFGSSFYKWHPLEQGFSSGTQFKFIHYDHNGFYLPTETFYTIPDEE